MVKKIILLSLMVLISLSLNACKSKDAEVTNDKEIKKELTSVEKIKQSGKLVIATSADYPPFESIDEKDGKTVIGFDADIAAAIAKKIGVQIEVKNIDFKGLLPALMEGKTDIVAAGMSADAERLKSVDFSKVYFVDKQMLVIKENNDGIKTAADMSKKKIGAQLGSTCEKAAQGIPGIEYKSMDKVDQLMLEVKNGRLDGVVVNLTVAVEYVKSIGGLKMVEISELNKEAEGYAIAVKKGDAELIKLIDGVIEELKASGEYNKLLTKWGLDNK